MNIIIGTNFKKDGITLEEVMEALGVRKELSPESRQKIPVIRDLNEMNKILLGHAGKKVDDISSKDFDTLYDMSISKLADIEHSASKRIAEHRYSRL